MSRGNDGELAGRLTSRANEDRTMMWDQTLEDRVAALTPEEILTVMRRYIDLSKMLLIRAGDFAKVKAAAGQSAN